MYKFHLEINRQCNRIIDHMHVAQHHFVFHCETNHDVFFWHGQVHDSGHMVPMDQPKAALEMLKRWTSGNLSDASSSSKRLDFAM
jgi:hypothetical protein